MNDHNTVLCHENVSPRILVPIETLEHATQALDWLKANRKLNNVKVILVHILNPAQFRSFNRINLDLTRVMIGTILPVPKDLMKTAKTLSHEAIRRAELYNLHAEVHVFVNLRPAEAILKALSQLNAEEIVLPRRRGNLKRAMFGNTGLHVIQHAPVPVTLTPLVGS